MTARIHARETGFGSIRRCCFWLLLTCQLARVDAAGQPPGQATGTAGSAGVAASGWTGAIGSGVCYGPYTRAGQQPGVADPPEAQVRQEVAAIDAVFTPLLGSRPVIRTYSARGALNAIPAIAGERGMVCSLGVWLGSNQAANQQEVNAALALLPLYPGQIESVVVGNETDFSGCPNEALIGFIGQLKAAAGGHGIPVTSCQTDGFWISPANANVVGAVDFVMANIHPFWAGVPIGSARQNLDDRYRAVVNAAGGKQVVVSEVGWPSAGSSQGAALPSHDHQKTMQAEALAWAAESGAAVYLFAAFNEPWKAEPGGVGPYWGLTHWTVTAAAIGQGSISGAGEYDAWQTVFLTATALPGHRFAGWTGDCTGDAGLAEIFVDGDKTVAAVFVADVCGLEVQSTPDGLLIASTTGHGGTTDYAVNGIARGTAVNLSVPAVDPEGFTFRHWRLNGTAQPDGQRTIDFPLTADTVAVAVYLGGVTHTVVYEIRYRQTAFAGTTALSSLPGRLAIDLDTGRMAAVYGDGTTERWNEAGMLVFGVAEDGSPFPPLLIETGQAPADDGTFALTALTGRRFGPIPIGPGLTADLPRLLTGCRHAGDREAATLLAGRFAARFDYDTTAGFNIARTPFDDVIDALRGEPAATALPAPVTRPAALPACSLVYRTRAILRSAGDGTRDSTMVKGYLLAAGSQLAHIVWGSSREGRFCRVDDLADATTAAFVADGGTANQVQVYAIQPPVPAVAAGELVRLQLLAGRTVPDTAVGTTRREAVATRLTGCWHRTGEAGEVGDCVSTAGGWTATLDTAWTRTANDSGLGLSALVAAIVAELGAHGYVAVE